MTPKIDKSFRILIVDDDQMIAEGFQRLLADTYTVDIATSVVEAQELFAKHQPQMIITDHDLPNGNGLGYLHDIKLSHPDLIRLIICSRRSLDKVTKWMDNGEIYYFLMKPINVESAKNIVYRAALEYQYLAQKKQLLTTIKNQNDLLLKQNETLARHNKTKTSLIRNLTHRFATPLTTIMANSELLLTDTSDGPLVHDIYARGLSLSLVVENIQLFALLEADQLPVNPVEVSLASLCEDVASRFAPNMQRRSVQIEWSFSSDLSVRFDVTLLKAMMTNLLKNAIKYAADNSTVVVGAFVCDQTLHVSVSNDGPMQKRPDLQSIFDSLYRSDDRMTQADDAVNLGLGINQAILQTLGGAQSYVYDDAKAVTTFQLNVPL